jgi:hypothetical protein
VILVLSTLITTSNAGAQQTPRVLLLDANALVAAQDAVRAGEPQMQPAMIALRHAADKALARGPYTLTAKAQPPPSGDVHDYVSLSIYWWPDPASPTGLPYIQRDGVRNPEADNLSQYDASPLNSMVADVETLSLAYFMTGDEGYASHAVTDLHKWFIDPETRMAPNFRFAQIIPGRDAIRGTGIIESRRLTRIVDSAALLTGCACWTPQYQQSLRAWFADFQMWLRTSPNGQMESRTSNNHAVWYDVQLIDFALFADDISAAQQVADAARQARIDSQIGPDGSMPRELERTRSLHYSDFNLQAFFELATLSDRVGVDLWNYQSTEPGAGIGTALDFLVPYMTGQPWPYDEITAVNQFQENAQTLRRAAIAYPDAGYDTILSHLRADQSTLDNLRLDLGYWPD